MEEHPANYFYLKEMQLYAPSPGKVMGTVQYISMALEHPFCTQHFGHAKKWGRIYILPKTEILSFTFVVVVSR